MQNGLPAPVPQAPIHPAVPLSVPVAPNLKMCPGLVPDGPAVNDPMVSVPVPNVPAGSGCPRGIIREGKNAASTRFSLF